MPGGIMPYLMEKGPYFSVIEDLASTHAGRAQLLRRLREKTAAGAPAHPLANLAGLDSYGLSQPNGGDRLSPEDRKRHVNDDWFGYSDPGGQFTTGWWEGWDGEPEAILREGLIRAIEVSFGIQHDDPPPAVAPPGSGTGPAPMCSIDIYWICQGPWFQCWVDWTKSAAAVGHVVLVITTPPAYGHPLRSRIGRDHLEAVRPEYASEPAPVLPPNTQARALNPNAAHGMWVIGHDDYVKEVIVLTAGTAQGTAEVTVTVRYTPRNRDRSIRVVSPSESEGGVLPGGRQY